MLLTLGAFSLALGVLVVALFFKGKRWDEYVVGFFAVFMISLCITLSLTNAMGLFPVVRIESWFPIP